MVNEHLPVACRYVPYDQWLITHIDPTWKIKHLKQRIISKCLNLPFDPRFIQKDVTSNARPPSPITFAPDASVRADSPIEFAVPGDDQESAMVGDEGYEEDDEWEQDLEIGLYGSKITPSNAKLKSKASSPTTSKFHVRLQQKQIQEQEPQIPTDTYTLFRFSTGQVLEEGFQISWYDIQPHELVELHSAFLLPTLASSLGSPSSQPTVVPLSNTKSTQNKVSSPTTTADQGTPQIPSVTFLPRHIPNLYIQPHWQGWVRVLKALWRKQTVPPSDERPRPSFERHDSYIASGREGDERGMKQVGAEWRERWVVIHDGIVNIAKGPTDPNPTRLPLSSLLALQGPEHLAHSTYAMNRTSKRSTRSKLRSPELSTTTAGTLRSRNNPREDLPRRSAGNVDKDKQNTRTLMKTHKEGQYRPYSTTTLQSPGRDRQTPISTSNPTTSTLTAEERERDEKALEKKKEMENLKKWDELGFPFYLAGKDKRDKERDKEKEREDKARELRRIIYSTSEKEYKEEKERRARGNDKSRSRTLRDSKTFIPTTREEAEQAGMRIVCAKFLWPPGGRDQVTGDIILDGGFPKTRRYTSTGPSLALVAASVPGGGNTKKTSTGPHIVIDMDVQVGKSTFENSGDGHGRHQLQTQPQGILIGSSRTSPMSPSGPGTSDAGSSTTTFVGTESVNTSPVLHPTWSMFGSVQIQEHNDDNEHKTTERRDLPTGIAEDVEASATTTANDLDWRPILPPKPAKNMEPGDVSDVQGYDVSIPEPSDVGASSWPGTTRPNVVTPSLASVPTPSDTATTLTTSPVSQSPDQVHDDPNSDSSSSVSISSPVFAHSANESDDETFLSGGTTSGVSSTNKPRMGYRYGGYHVQTQTKKGKSDGEDGRLTGGDGRGVGKPVEVGVEVEVESKPGDGSQPQHARREENVQEPKNKDEEYLWFTFDLINDNAFHSILRILHRHASLPLSSSFTPSHLSIASSQPAISNKLKLNVDGDCHDFKAQVPSDTDDDYSFAAPTKNPTSHKAIHPPILESLAARTVHPTQQPLYVALPYPEWRLELVKRARRAGMREKGRPLDLALHGWGREFEEMAAAARERRLEREMEMVRNKRMSVQSHVSTIKGRGRRVSRVVGGSDADDDEAEDDEEEETMGTTQLDTESEEESDTEWLAWMTDLPRQTLVRQSQLGDQPPQTSSSIFTNPFSSSPLLESAEYGPVPPPRTQEEERLLHADKIRKLEPYAISVVSSPTYLPSPKSASFADSQKQFQSLPSRSSFESSSHQRRLSLRNSTPFPGVSSPDDITISKGHTRSQSRSLQHLGSSYRQAGSVPEEGGSGHNASASSSSSRQGLHHSASVDQHLSRKKFEIDTHRQNHSIASQMESQHGLGKPILTNEQIQQIESEVFSSALPSHWAYPPIPMPSPPARPPSSMSQTPSHTPSASTSGPGSSNAVGDGETKAYSSLSTSRFVSDSARWSTALSSTPSSPSAAAPPNSTSPPRSVFSSLGRSPNMLVKVGNGQEKKGFLLKKRMSRDLGKDKDAGDNTISTGATSPNQRPKLFLSSLSSSTPSPASSTSYRYHPSLFNDITSPIPNTNPTNGQHLYQSPSAISSARALLRRVRSGSSLRGEEPNTPIFNASASTTGLGVIPSPDTEVKEVQKKKKGPIDRIVRGFDSSLAFAEGR